MSILDQFVIKDDVIIVTGAAGGLGRELAKILHSAGANLILVDIDQKKLDLISETMQDGNNIVLNYLCDVSNKAQVLSLVQEANSKFGRIDALVNCAGILGGEKSIFEVDEVDWDAVLDVNLKGTWLCSTEVSRYMVQKNIKGRIVNISSTLGSRAQLNRVPYAASKAGVEHMTRTMAMELVDYGINVNCLAPGFIATEMVKHMLDTPEATGWINAIPMKRTADPIELAGTLLLLVSKASSYMTGSVIMIDGGAAFLGLKPVKE